MKAKTYHALSIGLMGLLILGAFVLNAFFPTFPSIAYAIGGFVLGSILLLVLGRALKRDRVVLSDERTRGNLAEAALDTWRISYVAMMAFIVVIFGLPSPGSEWIGAGRAVIVVMVLQAYLLLILQAIRNRKH